VSFDPFASAVFISFAAAAAIATFNGDPTWGVIINVKIT